jgi:hypothetical protein
LDGDSQRWLGAQFAKVIKVVLIDKKHWRPLRPIKAWASKDRSTVFISYAVPHPPLVVDTKFLPAVIGNGFKIQNGPAVLRATVLHSNIIALHLASPLPRHERNSLEYASENTSPIELALPSPILQVRTGIVFPNGHLGYEVIFHGDLRNSLKAIQQHGVFTLQNVQTKSDYTNGIIRRVAIDTNGNTDMEGEIGELRNGAQFHKGQQAQIMGIEPFGNIRDSDPTHSIYTFSYGPRKGQAYPLWNWSVAFEGLQIN